MAFFYSFTDSLKQKWLQFYASNRDWIKLHMEVDSVYTPDGGKRPSSYLILGVANALEPKLAQLMLPFSKLNADADTLVEVLDLHFDPDTALGKEPMEATSEEEGDDSEFSMNENPEEFVSATSSVNDSADVENVPQMELGDSHGETLVVEEAWGGEDSQENPNTKESGFDRIEAESLADIYVSKEKSDDKEAVQTPNAESEDAFGDISFDEFKDGNSTGFGDALTDVWSEESTQKDKEMFSGEDMTDDSEIASLFPNG